MVSGETMTDFISAAETALNMTSIWGIIAQFGTLIFSMVLVALSIYFVRRILKGVSKGKFKM